jgi:uncharacterized membrane protein (UPF0127 family)
MNRLANFLLFSLLALQSACSEELNLHIGTHAIHAEIADTPASRNRGLMHREQLCADCGMLFVFKQPYRHSFWMKNTPLPLSIAFISADGGIINIDEMQPNTTVTHDAQGNALYALEMNSGWFAENGVKPHDRVQGLEQLSRTGQ